MRCHKTSHLDLECLIIIYRCLVLELQHSTQNHWTHILSCSCLHRNVIGCHTKLAHNISHVCTTSVTHQVNVSSQHERTHVPHICHLLELRMQTYVYILVHLSNSINISRYSNKEKDISTHGATNIESYVGYKVLTTTSTNNLLVYISHTPRFI